MSTKEIKIFQVGEADYVAATSGEEAIQELMSETGISLEDIFGDEEPEAIELSAETMGRLRLFDEDALLGESVSFREGLDELIKRGEKFPYLFANSEY